MKFLEVEKQGVSFKVKLLKRKGYRQEPPPLRGHIKEFSTKSRKRLIETFCKLDRNKLKFTKERVKFITLTYEQNMTDGEKAKLHLKRFMERLQYKFDTFASVWKLETQERGSIHFHLICFGMPFTNKDDLQIMWAECSEQLPVMPPQATKEEIAKNCPFTRIEAIRSINGVLRYASKYMTKLENSQTEEDLPNRTKELGLSICHIFGRYWGIYGRNNMPFATKIETWVGLSNRQYNWFLSIVDSPYCNAEQGWSVFREDVDKLIKILANLHFSDEMNAIYLKQFMIHSGMNYNEQTIRWSKNCAKSLHEWYKITSMRPPRRWGG